MPVQRGAQTCHQPLGVLIWWRYVRAHRFSDLRRKMGGVSEKMLAQSLQALEHDGFVDRVSYPVVPPHVEYSLTPLGVEVSEKVAALADWIEVNTPKVMANRDERAA